MPELRPVAELGEQIGHDAGRLECGARRAQPELGLSQVPREHTRVVAIALDSAGVTRDPMFLEPRRPLGDGPGKENARDRRAFPEGGLRREAALAEGCNAQQRQVAKGRDEAGRGDDVIGGHRQLVARGIAGAHLVTGADFLHRFDRRIQNDDPAGEGGVLVGLHIAGTHAHERAGIDRQLRRAGRRQYQLPGPGEQAGRNLEP